jgi:hypothetical protein
MNATQTGSIALVAGQQSYAITFPTSYSAVPTAFIPTVQMPNDSGEVFEVSADLSTLTENGVTVWLSGVPSSASDGGYINWIAIGEGGSLPPVPTPGFTGITTVALLNRLGRRCRGGDFTKLSKNEKEDVIEAANAGLARTYNALPTYFKEQTQGFVLPAPLTVSVGVTQFGRFVTGLTFTDAQFGQTIVIDGDPGWNQIIGENELLNPYMGDTGTQGAIIYGNAIHSDTYPLDRIIGNPKFANQNLFPMSTFAITAGGVGQRNYQWWWAQSVGIPQVWWPQVFGNSQNKRPIMVLRFAPAPQQAYAINVRIGFWSKRLTIDDYEANSEIPVPDQFIESGLIPVCLAELMSTPVWQDGPKDNLIAARGVEAERFLRNQLGQVGAPNNGVYTPFGY